MEKIKESNSKSETSDTFNSNKDIKKNFINTNSVKEKQYLISIASFPRSGNTMIRNIYESITKSYTGDDMITTGHLSTFYGLGLVNNTKNVFLCKTHYPFMNFRPNEFKTQGAIFIVRNPFDAFDSFFEFSQTDSHTKKLSESRRQDEKVIEAFEKFVNYLTVHYKKFHEYWINNVFNKIPVKIIKYENFTTDKNKQTEQLFEFLSKFNVDKSYFNDLSYDEISKILTEQQESINTKYAYKPRADGKNYQSLLFKRYKQEQLDYIISELWDILLFFGYISDFKDLENENINSAIEKKEDSLKTYQPISCLKLKNISEITATSDILFSKFNGLKADQRENILINGDDSIECQFATNLKDFWVV